jgi:hypothetical protein
MHRLYDHGDHTLVTGIQLLIVDALMRLNSRIPLYVFTIHLYDFILKSNTKGDDEISALNLVQWFGTMDRKTKYS